MGVLGGWGKVVFQVHFFPDGRHALACGTDASFRVLNVNTGREVRRFTGRTLPAWPTGALSRDGKIALTNTEASLDVWDAETGHHLRSFKGLLPGVLTSNVSSSPDGHRGLVGTNGGAVLLWDAKIGKTIATFRHGKGSVRATAFSPDGRRALTASEDGSLQLWRLP